jgi:putative adenylate-forming enzyme
LVVAAAKNLIRLFSRFYASKAVLRRLKTRTDIAAFQDQALKAWMKDQAQHLSYFKRYAQQPLNEWPGMDKQTLMSSFGRYNRAGISTGKAWAIFDGRVRARKGLHVGGSTGTSGNRGLYVITDEERMDWLGVMLAKTLPGFPLQQARIALMLPNVSPLYRLPGFGPLSFRFYDLHRDLGVLRHELEAQGPDTLIAPPKTLVWLARAGARLPLKRLFAGAEVLDPADRAVIEAHFGLTVRDIYMATEGLLGVACEHGTLHLCEDTVKFAFEPVAGTDLVNPVITDFTRRTQAMVRYRMNDLLRLSDAPCPCGSPLQAVAAIEGRVDDVFELPDAEGVPQAVMPDVLRNTVIDASRTISDFRLQQVRPDHLLLTLPDDLPVQALNAAQIALTTLLSGRGLSVTVEARQAPLVASVRKLRRVERVWRPDPQTPAG